MSDTPKDYVCFSPFGLTRQRRVQLEDAAKTFWRNFRFPGSRERFSFFMVHSAHPLSVYARLIAGGLEYNTLRWRLPDTEAGWRAGVHYERRPWRAGTLPNHIPSEWGYVNLRFIPPIVGTGVMTVEGWASGRVYEPDIPPPCNILLSPRNAALCVTHLAADVEAIYTLLVRCREASRELGTDAPLPVVADWLAERGRDDLTEPLRVELARQRKLGIPESF